MIVKTFAWNFDPHASDNANFIKGERHTLTSGNGSNFRVLVPRGAPFFAKDLKVPAIVAELILAEVVMLSRQLSRPSGPRPSRQQNKK